MNYLELLNKELREKDWDLEHKRRHLYIRSCQMFDFDTRAYFVDPNRENYKMMGAKNADKIYQSLYQDEIDLENVESKKVTCFSWTKAYVKLVNELLGLKAFYAENMFGSHAWAMMGHKADATSDSDLTRVKMKLNTLGYILSTDHQYFYPDKDSEQKVKAIDQGICYIKQDYTDFKKIFLELKLELLTTIKNLDGMYNWWMNQLMEIYKKYQKSLPDFEDASYCLSYLFRYLFLYSDLKIKIVNANLFLDDDVENWNFADLYKVTYGKEVHWYLLSKGEIGYDFKEIFQTNAYHYLNDYKGDINQKILLKL